MSLPGTPANWRTERAGVLAVAAELNRMGMIWRETPHADVGIDGQFELVDDAQAATGRIYAGQVKSGSSYFHDGGSDWHFRPAARHRVYWERFPLPVLLFLHSPETGETYWVDARRWLRSPDRSARAYIAVPKQNLLQRASREEFLADLGASTRPLLSVEEVLHRLVETGSSNRSFPVSYFDLFTLGLTNITRSLYFGVDLAMEVAERLFDHEMGEAGVAIGGPEHDFIFGFVLFLVEQDLADVDVSDCMIDWIDREIQPKFVAPLTARGRDLVRLISRRQDELEQLGRLRPPPLVRVAQESFVNLDFGPAQEARLPLIQAFRAEILKTAEERA